MKIKKEDGEKDRDLYAKFKCYCDDNEADKKEAAQREQSESLREHEANRLQKQAAQGQKRKEDESIFAMKAEHGEDVERYQKAAKLQRRQSLAMRREEKRWQQDLECLQQTMKAEGEAENKQLETQDRVCVEQLNSRASVCLCV